MYGILNFEQRVTGKVVYEPAVDKSSLVKLTFIDHSGTNRSVFYLYTATSVGLSILSCAICASIREVWFMYGKVCTL